MLVSLIILIFTEITHGQHKDGSQQTDLLSLGWLSPDLANEPLQAGKHKDIW